VSLEPRVETALCQVAKALERAGFPYTLIGANALILHGVRLGRSTRDLDFVVAVETKLLQLREVLVQAGLRPSSIPHRFYTRTNVEADLLPLDVEAISTGWIRFPGGEALPAIGLAEAVRHGSEVQIGPCVVRVADLPLLVALKLQAASQRPGERDLHDAFAAMEQYAREEDRRFREVDYLTYRDLTYETAGAFLVARDLSRTVEVTTLDHLREVVGALLGDVRMIGQRELGLRFAPLLRAFRLGLALPPSDAGMA